MWNKTSIVLGMLGLTLCTVLMASLYYTGHTHGFQHAKALGERALAQQQAKFSQKKQQQAEAHLAELQIAIERYQQQTLRANQLEQTYLSTRQRLTTNNAQLQRKINDVTQRYIDQQGQSHPMQCVFTRGFVQQYNKANGIPTNDNTALTGSIIPTPSGGVPADSKLYASGVTARDILANINDNGEQCQALKAQVNGLLDYINGLG